MWYSPHAVRNDQLVRSRMVEDVQYDKLDEYVAVQRRQVEVAKNRGWQACSFWVPTTGTVTQFVQEAQYENLYAFQQETEAALKDEEFAELELLEAALILPGAARLDLLQIDIW